MVGIIGEKHEKGTYCFKNLGSSCKLGEVKKKNIGGQLDGNISTD